MTPEAQRIAIAEACGINTTGCREQLERFKDRESHFSAIFQLAKIPDYLSDLNAMHEAEKVLSNADYAKYEVILGEEVVDRHTHENLMSVTMMQSSSESATGAQRAEAFLRTLGLWSE